MRMLVYAIYIFWGGRRRGTLSAHALIYNNVICKYFHLNSIGVAFIYFNHIPVSNCKLKNTLPLRNDNLTNSTVNKLYQVFMPKYFYNINYITITRNYNIFTLPKFNLIYYLLFLPRKLWLRPNLNNLHEAKFTFLPRQCALITYSCQLVSWSSVLTYLRR